MLNKTIFSITEKILIDTTYAVSEKEVLFLADLEGDDIIDLLACANRITSAFLPKEIFTCTIINAKSGHCSQDCAFCAQSAHHQTDIKTYPLLSKDEMVANAIEMEKTGATYFSMVTSGERLTDAATLDPCLETWRARLAEDGRDGAAVAEAIRTVSPLYIPRNHIVEDVIEAGLQEDFAPFHAMNEVLADPYAEQPGKEAYAAPAPADGAIHRTFCGT